MGWDSVIGIFPLFYLLSAHAARGWYNRQAPLAADGRDTWQATLFGLFFATFFE
jgi:hypothetical protein